MVKSKTGGKAPVRKGKATKDPNAPKRNMSAYFHWLAENRKSFTKPGMPVSEVTKEAGKVWKSLKDKAKWEKLAEDDKKRYQRDMEEYRSSGTSSNGARAAHGGVSDDDEEESD